MTLLQPEVALFAVAAAMVLAAGTAWHVRRRGAATPPRAALANSDHALESARFRRLHRRYRWLLGAETVAVSGLAIGAVALAMRPAERHETEQTRRNRDVMLCLDVSGSMTSIDAEIVERFESFATELNGERIGMTMWDSSAVTVFPLTDDSTFVVDQLGVARDAFVDVDIDFTAGTTEGDGSSVIGDGLASCALRFDRPDDDRARSIILATDNQLSGSPIVDLEEAAALAAARDITVYAIAPDDYSFGDQADSPELAELRAAVESTGGGLYELAGEATVDDVVDEIRSREATEMELPPLVSYTDRPDRLVLVIAGAAAAWFAIGLLVRR